MSDEASLVTLGNGAMSIAHVVDQTRAVQEVMRQLMKPNEHYGTIPGTPKPTLLQPGADKLCMLFGLKPEFTFVERVVRDDLIMYEVKCVVKHRKTGEEWAEGVGACNSREKRYQSQTTAKVCPGCKKATIIKGKKEYGGGWICFTKKGGCGLKWTDEAPEMVDQEGQVQRDGVYDLQNTICKMAQKRAKVAAVLNATAATDLFTQDLEDLQTLQAEYIPPKAETDGGSTPSPAATPGTSARSATPSGTTSSGSEGPKEQPMSKRPSSRSANGAAPSDKKSAPPTGSSYPNGEDPLEELRRLWTRNRPEGLGKSLSDYGKWMRETFPVEKKEHLTPQHIKDAYSLTWAMLKSWDAYELERAGMWAAGRKYGPEADDLPEEMGGAPPPRVPA